jgi:hypothetical protein
MRFPTCTPQSAGWEISYACELSGLGTRTTGQCVQCHVSALVRGIAERIVSATTEAVVINPQTGPFSIENESQKAEAVPEVMRLIRESRGEGFDAYALACFDDIGLHEARRIVDVPVVGTFEAGIAAARALGDGSASSQRYIPPFPESAP